MSKNIKKETSNWEMKDGKLMPNSSIVQQK